MGHLTHLIVIRWKSKFLQCGPPQWCERWFINPMNTIVISTINHSYWSYSMFTNLAILGAPHCTNSMISSCSFSWTPTGPRPIPDLLVFHTCCSTEKSILRSRLSRGDQNSKKPPVFDTKKTHQSVGIWGSQKPSYSILYIYTHNIPNSYRQKPGCFSSRIWAIWEWIMIRSNCGISNSSHCWPIPRC